MPKGFFSTDYFPLLPWLFLFWAGFFLHHLVGRERMQPLRRSVCPPLGWLGRHSLVLYLLHQPVILGGADGGVFRSCFERVNKLSGKVTSGPLTKHGAVVSYRWLEKLTKIEMRLSLLPTHFSGAKS